MTDPTEQNHPGDQERVDLIADRASGTGTRVAVAESLTCGQVSALLGQGPDATSWFRGAVVAYSSEVKFDVLGVSRGPVVSETCARQMAEGVRRLLGADVGLGITGVGGPDSEEGKPPGTVHLAVSDRWGTHTREVRFDGDPGEVVAASTSWAVLELARALGVGDGSTPQERMAAPSGGTGRA